MKSQAKAFALLFLVPVLLSCPVSAQSGFKLFFEKVYLHLDRNCYAGGESIWFKAYLTNGQSNRSTTSSNNLYVELVDPNGQVAARELVRIDNGVGLGDFKLDDTLPTGAWNIRAYTNWMRNFGTHFVFEKNIFIAGPLPPAPAAANSSNSGDAAPRRNTSRASYSIQFLPEGGLMVDSLPTMVAFKTEDGYGNSVDAIGCIVSTAGDTVARFSSNWHGMGRFAFTPKPGMQYRAMVQYKNRPAVAAPFPASYADGFVLNVDNTDASGIQVSVAANAATLARHTGEFTLAGRHGGLLYYKEKFTLSGGKASVKIPRDNFPDGIASITLYDEKLRPQCERLLYVDKNEPLQVKIETDKTSYESRGQTTVHITVTDAAQQPVKAAFSLSAVDGNLVKEDDENIASYLLLSSELTGRIESAASYFDPANKDRRAQLDLLLATQGWRSFVWRLMADTSIRISYLPEGGITISGHVRELFANKPLPNMNITMIASGARGDKLYTARTDSAGKYYIDGVQLFGNQPLKINSKNDKGKKGGWIFMDTLFNNPLPVYDYPFFAADTAGMMKTFAAQALDRYKQSQKDPTLLREVVVTTRAKTVVMRDGNAYSDFGYPEFNRMITQKDYKFETLANYLIHNVDGCVADVENDAVSFIANGKPVRPRIIVDKREDVFERIDYYQVHMDQVVSVNVRHLVGHPSYNRTDTGGGHDLGTSVTDVFIISLVLKPGAFNTDMAMIVTDVTGYYNARAFYAPVHQDETLDRKQDLRTTIHWAPVLSTDAQGHATISYYNADPKTNVRVHVEGLSEKGIPFSAATSYPVR
ncbi:MAG: hypothetical protein JST39_22170 [Bacteroidetes bacterium]|nr:hypothetical protein [Bacteroidota bacterium]